MQKSIDTALKILNDKVFENVNYLASNKGLPDMIVSSIEEETEDVKTVIKFLENLKEMLKPKPIKVEPYIPDKTEFNRFKMGLDLGIMPDKMAVITIDNKEYTSHEEYMSQFKKVSKEEYEDFLKTYNKPLKINFFMDWFDHYDKETNQIVARNYFDKYYILKEQNK